MKKNEEGIILNIKAIPNAKKNQIVKGESEIKIKIAAPKVDGKANKELIKYLSSLFNVKKSDCKIIKGERSEHKTILIKTNQKEKTSLEINKILF